MAWYPLNGDLEDYTGNENGLINNGAVVNNNGKIGKCYYNNGINSNLKIPIKTSKTMTFMLWIKIPFDPTTISGFKHIIDCRDGAGYETLVFMPTYLKFFNSSKNLLFSEYNDFKDKWHHIATTINANTKETKLFIDGELKVTATSNESSENASGYAVIGSRYSNEYYIEEYINDIRIYNHCLSDAEVKEISKAKILHYTMSSVYGGSNLVSKTSSWNGNWVDRSETKVDGEILIINKDSQYPKYERIAVKSGEKYTISVDVKGSENNSKEFNLGIIDYLNSDNSRITYREAKGYFTNSWKRRFWKITVPNNSNIKYLSFGCRNNMGGNFVGYFKHLKIEKGWVDDPIWIPKETDEDYSKYCLDRKEYDISGNSYYGERVGDISFETNSSKYCSSTYFNGNSYITTQNNKENISKILNTNTFTISTWVYPTNLSNTELQTIFMCRTPKTTNKSNQVFIAINLNRMMVSYYDDDTSFNYNFTLNKWYHIVVSSNSQEISIYINGESIGTANKSALLLSETAIPTIGADSDRDERYFYGNISDFRIYSTALSDEDILRLYQDKEKVDNLGNLYCSELNEVERRVEYLESHSYDGAANYINTKVNPTNNTAIEIKINVPSDVEHSWDRLYGCHNYFRTQASDGYGNKQNFYWDYPDNAQVCTITFEYDTDITIKQDKNYLFVNGELQYTFTDGEWAVNNPIYLFYAYASDRCGIFKLYYCKIWEDGILVRDFLPTISTEEGHIGEACLFDTVENKYYYNQGTRKFTTNLDESTTNIDFTSKGIVNTDYIIEGNDTVKIKNNGNIIEVNNLYEN